MNQEEIIELFKDKGTQCTMYKDKPDSLVYGLYNCRLLEVLVTLDIGTVITVLCREETVVDVTSNYLGIGSTLISPIGDIVKIDIKWR